MDKHTLKALKASIRHWEANVRAKTPYGASVSEYDCALCGAFIDSACKGCPVKARTGRKFCQRSPYVKARRQWLKWGGGGTREQWQAAAQAELDFLRSLLPTAALSARPIPEKEG